MGHKQLKKKEASLEPVACMFVGTCLAKSMAGGLLSHSHAPQTRATTLHLSAYQTSPTDLVWSLPFAGSGALSVPTSCTDWNDTARS